MTTLLLCLLIMLLLPYAAKAPLGYAMTKLGHYDNHQPREQQAKLTGFGARALAAHQNSFEALSVFSAVVLAAIVTHHTDFLVQVLAVVYVLTRLAYHVFYLMDLATLRSLSWFAGYICCIVILILCFY